MKVDDLKIDVWNFLRMRKANLAAGIVVFVNA